MVLVLLLLVLLVVLLLLVLHVLHRSSVPLARSLTRRRPGAGPQGREGGCAGHCCAQRGKGQRNRHQLHRHHADAHSRGAPCVGSRGPRRLFCSSCRRGLSNLLLLPNLLLLLPLLLSLVLLLARKVALRVHRVLHRWRWWWGWRRRQQHLEQLDRLLPLALRLLLLLPELHVLGVLAVYAAVRRRQVLRQLRVRGEGLAARAAAHLAGGGVKGAAAGLGQQPLALAFRISRWRGCVPWICCCCWLLHYPGQLDGPLGRAGTCPTATARTESRSSATSGTRPSGPGGTARAVQSCRRTCRAAVVELGVVVRYGLAVRCGRRWWWSGVLLVGRWWITLSCAGEEGRSGRPGPGRGWRCCCDRGGP